MPTALTGFVPHSLSQFCKRNWSIKYPLFLIFDTQTDWEKKQTNLNIDDFFIENGSGKWIQ
jgi:hypothetical protein